MAQWKVVVALALAALVVNVGIVTHLIYQYGAATASAVCGAEARAAGPNPQFEDEFFRSAPQPETGNRRF